MKTNSKAGWHVRQGDVVIIAIDKLSEKAKRVDSITLALGEKTGHHHTMFGGGLAVLEEDGRIASEFSIEEDQVLTHQEHDPITIPKGTYMSVIQQEFLGNELKRVAD